MPKDASPSLYVVGLVATQSSKMAPIYPYIGSMAISDQFHANISEQRLLLADIVAGM